jgi:serine/threonine protein kinase
MSPEHKYSLPPGSRLRQYVIVRMLGHGGFGLTYLADDTKLDRKVAIKELLPMDFAIRKTDGMSVVARSQKDKISLEWARQRFLEEGQTLAGLHHPSILPVYEIFQEHGTAYLVTAFIEGENLEDWLRKSPRPSEKEIRSMAISLLDALELVHEHGYLHRDVKPENILMDRQNRVPILIDFGNARIASGAKSANLTAVLTKGYAPIEQYQTKGRQGPYTDLYALGAVLYRIIKGVAPEDAADRWEQDKVESLCQRPPPGYSRELLATVDKALQMQRENRWQNCRDWKAALGVSDQILRPFPGPTPGRWKAAKVLAAITLLAVGGVGIGLLIKDFPSIFTSPDTAVETPSPSPTPAPPPNPDPTPRIISTTPTPIHSVTPAIATANHPFVNALGMKFVPVTVRDGRRLLFCIHETRKRDYGQFAASHPSMDNPWQHPAEKGVPVSATPDHPVVEVSFDDAKAFCAWLTDTERASGKIGAQDVYRLPTDDEWSCAVGLVKENPAESPITKSRANKNIFPWGEFFNPLGGRVGNYADEEMGSKFKGAPFIKGYNDGYATTAPVMTFDANTLGIYDLGGNVMEWCDTHYYDKVDNNHPEAYEIRRGGSWKTEGSFNFEKLSSSSRNAAGPDSRETDVGFRCVLAPSIR